MTSFIVSFVLSFLLFVWWTIRIRQEKARASLWKKVAIAAGAAALVVYVRRKGVSNG